MGDALWMRLRDVAWGQYEVSGGGKPERLGKLLQDLASRKRVRAMRASQEIWRMVCSGGVRSSAAAVVPFLVEIIDVSEPEVRCEILDILKSVAVGVAEVEADWAAVVKADLLEGMDSLFWLERKARGDVAIAWEGFVGAVDF